jgi:hypothetical protein
MPTKAKAKKPQQMSAAEKRAQAKAAERLPSKRKKAC